jgi:hypothetical protein
MRATSMFVSTVLLFGLGLAGTTHAAPPGPIGTSPAPRQQPRAKLVTAVQTSNVLGAVGDSKVFEATVTANGAPLAGKLVTFSLSPPYSGLLGTAKTDATGKAKASYLVPPVGQKTWAFRAAFAGDDDALASEATASFTTLKAATKLELGDLSWGSYKNEEGGEHGTISVKLTFGAPAQTLAKPVTMKVNGQPRTLPATGYSLVALPTDATTWTVSVAYDGDESHLSAAAERTYHKP